MHMENNVDDDVEIGGQRGLIMDEREEDPVLNEQEQREEDAARQRRAAARRALSVSDSDDEPVARAEPNIVVQDDDDGPQLPGNFYEAELVMPVEQSNVVDGNNLNPEPVVEPVVDHFAVDPMLLDGAFDVGAHILQDAPDFHLPNARFEPLPVVVPVVRQEEDGGNEAIGVELDLGHPRNPPRTPPLEPGMEVDPVDGNVVPEYDEVSDGEIPERERVGPRTPPDDDYVPPEPAPIQLENVSDGELSEHEADTVVLGHPRAEAPLVEENREAEAKRPRTPPQTPPPRSPRPTSRSKSPRKSSRRESSKSPKPRQPSRESRPRKRRQEKEIDDELARELSFPAVATQKCLSLLEFVEKKGLTITDDELLQIVRHSIVLDKAMEKLVDKKKAMKRQIEDMAEQELENIRKIHGNMPRHMQDVLKFDGKTVHIAQERAAMPPMPFGSSTLMSLKYGQSMAHHLGMPHSAGLVASGFGAQTIGLPPPAMGLPPPLGMSAPGFGVPPPLSLLGAAPFGASPILPPPPVSSLSTSRAVPQPPPRLPVPPKTLETEGRGLAQGLNPIAFANAPPGLKLAPMPEYSRPPPAKKAAQNPQMTRITNNLSSMLTNALKAQVSKAQSPFNTAAAPTTPKKAVPSLMSINIPGVPKPSSQAPSTSSSSGAPK